MTVGPVPRSLVLAQLKTRLAQLGVDELVSWDELERLTGKPRNVLYQAVNAAKNSLRKKHKMFFVSVYGKGIQRIDHAEVARAQVPHGTRKLRGIATRNLRTIADLDLDLVSEAEKLTVLAHASINAFVRASTSRKAVKRLEATQTPKALTPEEAAAALFKQLKKG